jgi:hypothetical protein
VRLSLDKVEPELSRLWQEETDKGGAPRIGLFTLVALASELPLLGRAQRVVADAAAMYPSRTIVAMWRQGADASVTADAALHRVAATGAACGDAIVLEATGAGREWLPEYLGHLALTDLPMCVWWVGDLPDFDKLFDRVAIDADLVIVNSGEMDLRDLEKLSMICRRIRDSTALTDLTWFRLRPVQELIARFFDDPTALALLRSIERVTIEFSPRDGDVDATSTQSGLLFGWIANALGVKPEGAQWKRGPNWSEVAVGSIVGRFDHRHRDDVPPGSVLRIAMECDGARFEIERQEDPGLFKWSREAPGAPVPSQIVRIKVPDESTLLIRSLERPKRDLLYERSLHLASKIVRIVAPRLSKHASSGI